MILLFFMCVLVVLITLLTMSHFDNVEDRRATICQIYKMVRIIRRCSTERHFQICQRKIIKMFGNGHLDESQLCKMLQLVAEVSRAKSSNI